jgi:glycosyltransferase involved in cell wall biosynthesis
MSSLAILWRLHRLQKIADAERPDVLLVGDPAAHQVCSWLGAERRGGCWPIFYGSELLGLAQRFRESAAWPIRRVQRATTLRYVRGAGGILCISRHTAGLLRRLDPALQASCIVYPAVSQLVMDLPRQVEFSKDLRCSLAGTGSAPTILLTVARISERKNQLGVLEAMVHAHRTSPERFHYLMVGNVDSPAHAGYLEQIQGYIKANGLEGSVTLVPNASDEQKVCYLDACDIFVMLSRTVGNSVEGFGIAPIEASCREKPVVVSNEGGMPETIIEGQTGYAVPPADTGTVADTLVALARDVRLRTRMGQAGRDLARREFIPERTARRLHEHVLARGLNPKGR